MAKPVDLLSNVNCSPSSVISYAKMKYAIPMYMLAMLDTKNQSESRYR